ncbi:MAG: hypothetical protein B7Z66_15585 [Chromatiales bacterium 21-64-14]|nr:MAG: hypothetical protein B7Z66_15585 [Chromatiales bacterium 21-64-14]
MDNFLAAWQDVLGNEGGYSNNPADPGGATMYGVTQRVARRYGYMGDMRDLPLSMAQDIARSEYWNPYQCDKFDPRVAFQVFDTAYNGGEPVKWLQQDGIMGPKTVTAVNLTPALVVVMRFCAYRLQYYTSLKGWPTFGKGWTNRVANNLLKGAK